MRKIVVLAVLIGFSFTGTSYAIDAVGSAFGTLATARVMGQGKANFMGAVGIADATSFFGTVTYGVSEEIDGRLKLGLIDPGSGADTKFTIGADTKWQFWRHGTETNEPLDMAFGGQFEYVGYESLSIFQIGANVIGSYPAQLSNGDMLSPYARLNIRLESISLDAPAGGSDYSESNLKLGLNAGVAWQVTDATALFAEFQLDGNDGLFVGIDFNVM